MRKAVGTNYVPGQVVRLTLIREEQRQEEIRKREEKQVVAFERAMDKVGYVFAFMAVILFTALLVVNIGRHFGW